MPSGVAKGIGKVEGLPWVEDGGASW